MDSSPTRVRPRNQGQEGDENLVADHLSRLQLDSNGEELPIDDAFIDEHLCRVESNALPWYADLANYLAMGA